MKRFYKAVTTAAMETGAFEVHLDNRPVKAPGGNALNVPTEALAAAIAGEWQAQNEKIEPAAMPLTQLAFTAMDRVAGRREEVIEELVRYGGTDLLCYRAGGPVDLVEAQAAAWDPLLAWAEQCHGARLLKTDGLTAVAQPEASLEGLRTHLESLDDYALAAVAVVCRLAGSVVIALAVEDRQLTGEDAAKAAHVDDLYQQQLWGEDAEAAARLSAIGAEMADADRFLTLLRGG